MQATAAIKSLQPRYKGIIYHRPLPKPDNSKLHIVFVKLPKVRVLLIFLIC